MKTSDIKGICNGGNRRLEGWRMEHSQCLLQLVHDCGSLGRVSNKTNTMKQIEATKGRIENGEVDYTMAEER